MNSQCVLFHLRDAAEDLQKTILEVEAGSECGFEAWLIFVYRKLNLSWNCKHMTEELLEKEDDAEFERRCGFPEELRESISEKEC